MTATGASVGLAEVPTPRGWLASASKHSQFEETSDEIRTFTDAH
mgnify:CR=1 FL=1